MSQSPVQAEAPADDADGSAYLGGWAAIANLIRSGRSLSGSEADRAFLNLGPGGFVEASAALGLDQVRDGRAIARVDWDQDGDLDLLTTGRDAGRFRYLRSDLVQPGAQSSAPSIVVRLVGSGSNTDAIGARIEWVPDGHAGQPFSTVRRAGEGFLAQSSGWKVLGLGSAASASLRVHWPAGESESFGDLERGRRYLVVQGSGRARRASPPSAAPLLETSPLRAPQSAPTQDGQALVLVAPMPLPSMEMLTADGRQATLFGVGPHGSRGTGQPLAIQLWASWCAPCIDELASVGAQHDSFRAAGLDLLALSLDQPEEHRAALDILDRIDWPGSRGFAPRETAEVLDALVAALRHVPLRLPLPTTLLVDPNGRLLAIYTGAVEPAQLLKDLDLVGLQAAERRRRAVPYDGRFLYPPAPPNLARMEDRLRRRGLQQAATEYALAQVQVRNLDGAQMAYEHGVARARQGRSAQALELFRKSVELDATSSVAWSALGWAAETEQEWQAALEAYRRAVALDGQDSTARFNLGRLGLVRGDPGGSSEAKRQIEALGRLDVELAQRLQALLDKQD